MQSAEHKQHISDRTSHANCSECRADTERRFVHNAPFRYAHVREYLGHVKPRLEALRNGETSVNARIWKRDFILAMNRRITSHIVRKGRKYSPGYLDRFRQWRGMAIDAGYLRQFAARGASCLDYR